MIARLKGTIAYRGIGYIIVDVAGVGYKVTMPEQASQGLSGEVVLFTHEVQRDDGRELFGFENTDMLELFQSLISVSGVGPKSGQKIVYAGHVNNVKSSIMKGDLAFLSSISGIGKKTAQKIILELKGVLAEEEDTGEVSEAADALMAMGYSRKQALGALEGLEGNTEETIRAALKRLSR